MLTMRYTDVGRAVSDFELEQELAALVVGIRKRSQDSVSFQHEQRRVAHFTRLQRPLRQHLRVSEKEGQEGLLGLPLVE